MLKDNGPGFEVGCKTGKDIQLSKKIKGTKKTTLLSISHDISIVRYLSDRVIVMYLGHVVELGSTDQIFSPPYHPYTEAILSAVPIADTNVEKKHIFLEGDIPSAMSPSIAALFKSAVNGKKCSTRFMQKKMPPQRYLKKGHQLKCHFSETKLSEMTPVIKLASE